MMLLGDEFDATAMCSMALSPIRVEAVTPLKSGHGMMKLGFFHANYPSGVQGKEYTLQTIHRGRTGLLARSVDHDPPRFLYITELTMHWLQHNFPHANYKADNPQDSLNHMYGCTEC